VSRVARVVVGLALAVPLAGSLTGCIGLPTDGAVVDADVAGEQMEDQVSSIDGRPPQPGASRVEVVNGFLESMMAWPISTNVAKEYLTDDAAAEWSPDSTIIYSSLATPREDGSTVSRRMRDATLLDQSGGWRGAIPADRSTLEFQLTVEDGEFRIVDPMDALVVRTTWFQQRYRQASLYYFDPTGQVLVPEPVFVPAGESFSTNLVNALLAGPPARLRGVVDTFIPSGLSVGLSVPVVDGIAALDLQGDAPQTSPAVAELMLAQLAATLSQEPEITALRVTIGGKAVDPPGGAAQYDVDSAEAFDPADTGTAGVLYGLQRGRVVSGSVDDMRVVDGPLGRQRRRLSSVAVAPVGDRIAAVSDDGRQVLIAPLRSPAGGTRVARLMSDGTGITQPSWDASGRLWVLDRGPGGARMLVSDDGVTVREVRVPGVSGTDARRILVSRDGTRLIVLVRRSDGDQLVAARVMLGDRGRVARVVDSTVIRTLTGQQAIDVAWTEAAQVAVVSPARPGELFEVETVAADGATVGVDTLSTVVTGRVIGLAGEPYTETAVYAVTRDVLVDIRTGERIPAPRVRSLDYAG
jgi:hypothetical protein